jgi:hypothetical protein
MWLGLAALVVAGIVGTLAWYNRDQSPRTPAQVDP